MELSVRTFFENWKSRYSNPSMNLEQYVNAETIGLIGDYALKTLAFVTI